MGIDLDISNFRRYVYGDAFSFQGEVCCNVAFYGASQRNTIFYVTLSPKIKGK